MDLSWFKDLGHLAKTGNFSQAAQLSNVSQPTLSRRVQAIEAWMGVPLVDRSEHPVRLNSAGAQILEAGQQALGRLESERSQIRESQSLPDKYVVTFGAQHSISWRFYPSWLQSFENAFGPIISRLRADDLPNCMQDLKDGHVDFVIAYHSVRKMSERGGDGAWDDYAADNSLKIGQDRLIPVCKPRSDGKPLFSFDSNTLEVPFLRFGDGAPISRHLEPLLETKQLYSRLRTVYENSMAGALRIRARDGAGVAWLPYSLVAPDLEYGLLMKTGEPEWEVEMEIRLHRNKEHANHLTRSIWAFLAVRESIPLTAGA
ncbi:MAG: LysR substrate-binding domain-containing protein [Albidovulum sp.]|nr:LysR substrate-binding domain-containing protein [Albidovulum sp.]